jgi:hypothetical protein
MNQNDGWGQQPPQPQQQFQQSPAGFQGGMPQGPPNQQQQMQNPFIGIEDASDNSGGSYIDFGTISVLQFVEPKWIWSKDKGCNCFIAIFKVIASNDPVKAPVGAELSRSIPMKYPSALSNVRRLVASIFGVPFEQVTADRAFSILHPSNPGAGRLILCDAFLILTQKNKSPFTKIKTKPIEMADAEEVIKQIAEGRLQPSPNDAEAVRLERAKSAEGQVGGQPQYAQPHQQQFQQPAQPPAQYGQPGAAAQQWGGPQVPQQPQQAAQPPVPQPQQTHQPPAPVWNGQAWVDAQTGQPVEVVPPRAPDDVPF